MEVVEVGVGVGVEAEVEVELGKNRVSGRAEEEEMTSVTMRDALLSCLVAVGLATIVKKVLSLT